MCCSVASSHSYSVIMPPPNITGVLHIGHVLNMTIQDILVRYHKNKGENVYWFPGIDHASIATEVKVTEYLKKNKNISKRSLSREEFIEYCYEWKETYGNTILSQIKTLNCLCNWEKLHFTLDEDVKKLVIDVFIKMFNDGLIYRSYRMINWDCKQQTALSDEEIVHREVDSYLYYLKYKITNSDKYLIVATSRPETIFGDAAICVNPKDNRYSNYIGQKVIIPLVNREIKIIGDEYVDKTFGSGCLKVTPAHDIHDYELGLKHHLDFISVLNIDGTLNSKCCEYKNKDILSARKLIVKKLQDLGLIDKIEKYKTRLNFSERTNTLVEPMMSQQWFVKMKTLANNALKLVLNGEIKFHPNKFINMFTSWMENIKDWCISRQLYWGHRIPIYYHDTNTIAAHDIYEASKLLGCKVEDVKQDPDVLDTWFSASLWPIVCTNNVVNLPTEDLVTGQDIIFFWVARMIMLTYYIKGVAPFKNVYFTGIIRDNIGRKISKSLGNSPDILNLIEKYSTDGVRFGLLLSTQAGNDIKFEERLCKQGRNFITKIKNAYRLLNIWEEQVGEINLTDIDSKFQKQECKNKEHILSFDKELKNIQKKVSDKIKNYRINEAAMILYNFFWEDFCSKLLEEQKGKVDKIGTEKIYDIFFKILTLLNPFIPETTDTILQQKQKK